MSFMKYGKKIIIPIIAEIIAEISTIPAEMSFAHFIVSSYSVVILSESNSIALLAISVHITDEIQMSMETHSIFFILNSNPTIITSKTKTICTFILRSCPNTSEIPLNAYTKPCKNPLLNFLYIVHVIS